MKSKDNKVLAICIPTYNRCDGLYKLVNHLLSCQDNRFCVHVSNNCSTDATLERLSSITDSRLSVTSTTSNIPAYDNYHNAIVTAPASYGLLLLDKETLDTSFVSDFINFLLYEQPNFGILGNRIKISVDSRFLTYIAGNEAVTLGGGNGDTHPTGFYYSIKRYKECCTHKDIKGLWRLDLTSLLIGTKYNAVNYMLPLYTWDYNSVLGGNSFSISEKKDIYFAGKSRVEDFRLFLRVVLSSKCAEVEQIVYGLLEKHLMLATTMQRMRFADRQNCAHYGVRTRKIGLIEMIYWMGKILCVFYRECKNELKIDNLKVLLIVCKQTKRCIKIAI